MSADTTHVPKSFWVISALALIWNLLGMAAYVMQVTMTEQTLLQYPEAERAIYANMPVWATSAFAIAVTAGTLGSALLLLRSTWAVPTFLLSLAGVFVQMYHAFVVANVMEVVGPSSAIGPAFVIGIGVALIWYSRNVKEKGWLR